MLAPAAHRQRLQPIAKADHPEGPPSPRVGLPDEENAAGSHGRGDAGKQALLVLGGQHVQHVEQEHRVAGRHGPITGVGRDNRRTAGERLTRDSRDPRPQL